jgi:hypothetical protein
MIEELKEILELQNKALGELDSKRLRMDVAMHNIKKEINKAVEKINYLENEIAKLEEE